MQLSPHLIRHIHFVGIGGIGMSGIAEVLYNLGYYISGSDVSEGANVQRLRAHGIKIMIGHRSENVQGAQVVVISTAVPKDNEEVVVARSQGIPVVQRAEMLGELMRLKFAVAVAGTHGKTTTTSLMAALFDEADLNPTVINGGIINAYNTNARVGSGEWVIAEADESDGSFTKLFPTLAVVTNIDADHMDFYGSFQDIQNAFRTFLERIPFYGSAILCSDHLEVHHLAQQFEDKRILTYGLKQGAKIRGVNLHFTPEGIEFDVDITPPLTQPRLTTLTQLPRRIHKVFLPMMGEHNVQNALAVVAVAQELGISDQVLLKALREFKGVKRRFTKTGEVQGVTIIDDYAHHPVEIETTTHAARQATQGKVIAVLQPHRFTRVKALFHEFVRSVRACDHVILAPVYPAGEKPLEGATSSDLAQAMKAQNIAVTLIEDPKEIPGILEKIASKGDMILCMGAGSITYWAAALPEQLEKVDLSAKSSFHHTNVRVSL